MLEYCKRIIIWMVDVKDVINFEFIDVYQVIFNYSKYVEEFCV